MKMSQRVVVGGSLALVLILVATASAQERRGRGGFGFGFTRGPQSLVSLAAQEPVQKDLGLSADAVSKVSSLNEEYGAARRKEMEGISFPQGFRDLSENERAARLEEYTKKTNEATAKLNAEFNPKLTAIVGEDSIKRLKQIQLQSQGAEALTSKEVTAELKITEEQQKKLAEVAAEYNTKTRELGRDGDQQERIAKLRELRTERDTKSLAVLTPQQKEQFTAMKGPAFDVSTLRTGFGGRRGNN